MIPRVGVKMTAPGRAQSVVRAAAPTYCKNDDAELSSTSPVTKKLHHGRLVGRDVHCWPFALDITGARLRQLSR
jgi:hypothetical protein